MALNKGLDCGLDLALSKEKKLRQQTRMRVPDWVQLYVKLETKLPGDGWQTVLNFLKLGRSGVSFEFLRTIGVTNAGHVTIVLGVCEE